MANSIVLVLLLAFSALSASADVSVSLDCGAIDGYTDENFIPWMGDEPYIQNGEIKKVQSGNAVSDHVMSSLRVFSTRKKNCYTIDADSGEQVLVRASFYYGNYDKKSSPPSFDLHFNGNYWATVETSSEDVVYYETIFVVKGDGISVCVAQTEDNQLPFISALEVRSLSPNMYSQVDGSLNALFLKRRTAYGTKDIIRYADDPYDRIWVPAVVGNGLTTVTSDAILIDVNVEDMPPQSVLKNAITTSTTSEYISLRTNAPATGVPIYINMYFSEMSELDSTQKRSFQIHINDEPKSDPIIPPYGSVTEMYITNMTATSNTTISLVATSDSTLPPLLNALEIFTVSDLLTDGTNSDDVDGLAGFQTQFSVLQGWGGDPCLPSSFTWDWVNCSSGATPRVTALYLSGFDLSGPLPDFSSMDALEIIDLHNNSLSGAIPDFLGDFPSLKQLNLADNDFSGPMPALLSKNNKLKLVVTGNPDVCAAGGSCKTKETEGSSSGAPGTTTTKSTRNNNKKKKSKLPAILGGVIPSFLVFWAIVGTLSVLHHRRKTAAIAAFSGGQVGGANRPQGGVATNAHMVNNAFKVNIEQQMASQTTNQSDHDHEMEQDVAHDERTV